MRYPLWLALFGILIILLVSSCSTTKLINFFYKKIEPGESNSTPILHQTWDSLLKQNVSTNGRVNYESLKTQELQISQYLELLSDNHPNEKNWSKEESIAYWINAYNAFTIKKILDNYPLESIKDIKGGITFVNTVWDEKFIKIEGKEYSLNNIEHGILRQYYEEWRIHFAVNCAAKSCPNLMNFAFTAEQLSDQLDQAAKAFIADESKNQITPTKIKLSKIFKWYKGDFIKESSLIGYLNRYSDLEISENAKVEYLDYDWSLNEIEY